MNTCTGTMVEIDLNADFDYGTDDGWMSEPVNALMKCLDECGQVNISRICELTGMQTKQAIDALRGAIIRNPDGWNGNYTDGFELMEEYVSGNLAKKLQTAKDYNEKYNGLFNDNIAVIRKAKPSLDIDRMPYVTLGSPWMPPEVIDEFIVYLLGHCSKHEQHTQYDPVTGMWSIPYAMGYKYNVRNISTYGTDAMNALKIIEKTLNAQTIEIMKPLPSWSKAKENVDREQTMLALDKQKTILSRFDSWVFADKERAQMIRDAYEKVFGGIVGRRYDGSFLTFPNMNPDVILRDHQINAVARIVFSSNTLLAHDVGTGKTYTMIAAAEELCRMGISHKNMFVVPNAIIGQWENDYKHLYPDSRVLIVDRRNFSKAKREQTLALVRDGDYNAVIIAASSFSMIPLSRKCRIKELERQKTELIQGMISNENARRRLISKKIDRINIEIGKLREESEMAQLLDTSEGICFDDLGITTLFVDEAHEYKNITIKLRSKAFYGIVKKGSAKCDGMLAKVHFTQRNGRGVVFATATPICNSMSDVYIMQNYLQSGELKFLGLSDFDRWSNTFARREEALELDVDGCSLKSVTRLSHFHNLPELSALFTQVADFYMDSGESKFVNCDIIDVKVSCPPELYEYIAGLSDRADRVRRGIVSRKDDNLLKITIDGKMAALDPRMIKGLWCDPVKTKSFRCAQVVFDIWQQTAQDKLTQIIFCDMSTPKKDFNVYNEVRFQLMKMGVPMREIAFIHSASTEAEKLRMFKRMNCGDIRILIGSTQKLGTGVNVQERLCAIHHLDIPWKPGDMTQREGRMIREGNKCRHMRIYRYVTKNSFDAFSWSLLERKQRFISEFMTNNLGEDAACDLEEMTLSFAEIKAHAVGNPLLRKRIETENDLNRMRALQRAYLAQRRNTEEELRSLPEKTKRQYMRTARLLLDSRTVKSSSLPEKEQRREMGQALLAALEGNVMCEEERFFDNFMGLRVVLPANMLKEEPRVILEGSERYVVPMGGDVFGNIKRLENTAVGIEERTNKAKEIYESMEKRLGELEEELKRPNVYINKITELTKKLETIDRQLQSQAESNAG